MTIWPTLARARPHGIHASYRLPYPNVECGTILANEALMPPFRFLMNKRERGRADTRLGDTLGLHRRLERISARDKMELVEERKEALRYLRRGALCDTLALACITLVYIDLAFPPLSGLSIGLSARLILLLVMAFPVYRLVNVMDTSQRAYYATRNEIDLILKSGIPEASRFDSW